jgi:hypothetical protein
MGLLQKFGLDFTETCNGVTEFFNGQQNQQSLDQVAFVNQKWAEPDSDRRPLARKANVLTRLDDRPTQVFDKRTTLVNIRILFIEVTIHSNSCLYINGISM